MPGYPANTVHHRGMTSASNVLAVILWNNPGHRRLNFPLDTNTAASALRWKARLCVTLQLLLTEPSFALIMTDRLCCPHADRPCPTVSAFSFSPVPVVTGDVYYRDLSVTPVPVTDVTLFPMAMLQFSSVL